MFGFVVVIVCIASAISTCSRNLAQPDACITESVEKLRPLLAVGDLGEGFQTPALEPMELEAIHMTRGPEFQATFKNLLVNGPSNFKIEKMR